MNIKIFEEMSMNAWPSHQTILYDGWIIRFADTITRRANSINPIYNSTINIDKKLEYCEKLYIKNKQQVVYKITSNVYPKNLDSILEEKLYKKEAITSLLSIDLEPIPLNNLDGIITDISFNDNWLNRFLEISETNKNNFLGIKTILENIKMKTCYIDLYRGDRHIGCGLGVLEDSYIGIFEIIIDKEERNKGNGYKIVNSIMSWGKANGAKIAYLQAMINNPSALYLYNKIGFKEEYKYWYRIKKRA